MNIGGLWNAYANWRGARLTGGEFVLLVDDVCAELCVTWQMGWPVEVGADRAFEDLEWFGMKPDRVEFSSSNHDRHIWAGEKLGIPAAPMIGAERPPFIRWFSWDPNNFCDVAFNAHTDEEGWYTPPQDAWDHWYAARCVVDSIDFGIGGWVAGEDCLHWRHWCLWAHHALTGQMGPGMWYNKLVKREHREGKESKSVLGTITLRQLRTAGYEPDAILETLRECNYRSRADGLQCVKVPNGVLELDEVRTLQHHNRRIEALAANGAADGASKEQAPYVEARAREELLRDTGAIRMPGSPLEGGGDPTEKLGAQEKVEGSGETRREERDNWKPKEAK